MLGEAGRAAVPQGHCPAATALLQLLLVYSVMEPQKRVVKLSACFPETILALELIVLCSSASLKQFLLWNCLCWTILLP